MEHFLNDSSDLDKSMEENVESESNDEQEKPTDNKSFEDIEKDEDSDSLPATKRARVDSLNDSEDGGSRKNSFTGDDNIFFPEVSNKELESTVGNDIQRIEPKSEDEQKDRQIKSKKEVEEEEREKIR